MGKYRGSKSPTVRLQTGRPAATTARISPAMRRISEPTRPAAMVETRRLGSGPTSRASSARSRQVCSMSMPRTIWQEPSRWAKGNLPGDQSRLAPSGQPVRREEGAYLDRQVRQEGRADRLAATEAAQLHVPAAILAQGQD